MKKIGLIFALAFVSVFALMGAACAGGGEESSSSLSSSSSSESSVEEEVKFQEPTLQDMTVDVSDRPEGLFVGDAVVTGVRLDGESAEGKYVVRGGYFMFTQEYYGDIGAGEHTLAFTFSNYKAVSVKINIEAKKAPDYTMPEGKFFEYQEKTAMELPTATKNRKYQTYEITYTLKDAKNQTVLEAGDGKALETPDIAEGIAAGTYSYTVNVSQNATTLEEKSYSIVVGVGENIFAQKHQDKWSLQAAANLKMSFDEEENAVKLTPLTEDDRAAAFTSHNRRIYSSSILKDAYLAGYETFTFEYKASFEGVENYGFRIYGNSKDRPTNDNMIKEIVTVSNTAGNLVSNTWTTVKIQLKGLFSQAEVDGISIVVLGNAGGSMMFRHAYFGYASTNVFGDEYTWSVVNGTTVQTVYDTTEQAMKATYNGANTSGSQGRDYVAYISVDKIKEMYDSGKKALNFSAKATSGVSMNVYAKQNEGRDVGAIKNETAGVLVYGAFALTNEYATYSIDLTKFFAEKQDFVCNYFAIVFYGEAGSVYLKDATYADEYVAPAIDYTKVNVFSNANYANWVLQSSGNVAKEFDATESAVKVTAKSYDDSDKQFTSKERRIYWNDIFRDAYEAGYTKFTFEYKSALTGTTNYGFRIYANDSTMASNNNMATQLKQVSGSDLVSGTWTTVEVDLSAFGTNENLFGISIVVIGNVDTSVLFRNGAFVKAQ